MYNEKKMIDKQESGIFYKIMFLKILYNCRVPIYSFIFYHFFNINISVLKLQQLPKNKIKHKKSTFLVFGCCSICLALIFCLFGYRK